MTAPTAAERVAAGAAHLDTMAPGWEADIDLDLLNMADSTDDILGQLMQVDICPMFTLGGITQSDVHLGMDIEWHGGYAATDLGAMRALSGELTELWAAEVRRRTGGAA